MRHIGKFGGVVRSSENGLAEVLADLVFIDIEGGHEFYVADVIPPEIDVHNPGNGIGIFSVFIVLYALDEGGCAVAHSDDSDFDFAHIHISLALKKDEIILSLSASKSINLIIRKIGAYPQFYNF